MAEPPGQKTSDPPADDERFRRTIAGKEDRKLRARRQPDRGPWFWLGMFGMVGWSVAIPTLLGIAIGVWLDRRFEDRISWTLTMLFIGVAVGCWTAWYWIRRESQRR
jgi:ATP synthase protein I